MAAPYRRPAPPEPDPPLDPAAARRALGPMTSRHTAPPRWRALIGPGAALLVALLVGIAWLESVWLTLAGAAIVLGFTARSSLRDWGVEIEVREAGLVLSRRDVQRVIPFAEVDEVWFEIGRFHGASGAPLAALRLLTFAREVHRLPGHVDDAAHVFALVFARCSAPLYEDARVALREGATLVFGDVQLDREGIAIRGGRARWGEIRKAALHHGRLHLYRRLPIVAWRTIRLDRVPNPGVLTGLLIAHVKERMQIDDLSLLPYVAGVDILARHTDDAQVAMQEMLIGVALAGLGLAILVAGRMVGGDVGIVAAIGYAPLVHGGWRFWQGLSAWRARRR